MSTDWIPDVLREVSPEDSQRTVESLAQRKSRGGARPAMWGPLFEQVMAKAREAFTAGGVTLEGGAQYVVALNIGRMAELGQWRSKGTRNPSRVVRDQAARLNYPIVGEDQPDGTVHLVVKQAALPDPERPIGALRPPKPRAEDVGAEEPELVAEDADSAAEGQPAV